MIVSTQGLQTEERQICWLPYDNLRHNFTRRHQHCPFDMHTGQLIERAEYKLKVLDWTRTRDGNVSLAACQRLEWIIFYETEGNGSASIAGIVNEMEQGKM